MTKRDVRTFFGLVHPGRTHVTISLPVICKMNAPDAGIVGELVACIQLGTITATFTSAEDAVPNDFTLRNYIEDALRAVVDAAGFLNGCGYDVEIIAMVSQSEVPHRIFGVDAPVLRELAVTAQLQLSDIFELYADSRASYLQRSLADMREAIRSAKDSAFFCYRAIESLRQFFVVEQGATGDAASWEHFRADLNVMRQEINDIKAFADPVRHGALHPITDEDRARILTTTWKIVSKFVGYAKNVFVAVPTA